MEEENEEEEEETEEKVIKEAEELDDRKKSAAFPKDAQTLQANEMVCSTSVPNLPHVQFRKH